MRTSTVTVTASVLLLLAPVVRGVVEDVSDESVELRVRRSFLSLSDVDRVLSSEHAASFGGDEDALRRADREERAHRRRRRRRRRLRAEGDDDDDATPWLACVEKAAPSDAGVACAAAMEAEYGPGRWSALYNGRDMACFVVSTTAEPAESASIAGHHVVTHALLPEMKLAAGTLDDHDEDATNTRETAYGGNVDNDAPPPPPHLVVKASLCPGATADASELSETTREHGRRLRASRRFVGGDEDCPDDDVVVAGVFVDALAYRVRPACAATTAARLASSPRVCAVEALPPPVARNVEAQWIVQGGADEDDRPFFEEGVDGTGQTVSVSDSGLDTDNCYFWDAAGELARDGTVDLARRKVVQYVPYADDRAAYGAHGTHTSGSVAGRRAIDGVRESDGEADGAATGAKLSFYDIGDADRPYYLVTPSDSREIFAAGHQHNGPSHIHSASWGIEFNGYGAQEREFDDYMYRHDDYLIVVAAGNSGVAPFRIDVPHTVGSPATAKNVLAVGATQSSGRSLEAGMKGPDYVADFSSRGPTRDGRMKPDVMAPGYFVLSANAVPDREGECDEGAAGLQFQAGTSMAAPIVAGTAALVRQYLVDGWYPDGRPQKRHRMPNPSAALIKAIMINGGRPLIEVQNYFQMTPTNPYDFTQGFGRVDLLRSLPLAGRNNITTVLLDRRTLANGDVHRLDLTIADNCGDDVDELSVTLVWSDPPARPNCQRCVLNDLDLKVVDRSDGDRHLSPNGLIDRRDALNNAERVRVAAPPPGNRYRVKIRATDLETPTQDYALAVAGCLVDDGGLATARPSASDAPSGTPTATSTPSTTTTPSALPTTARPSASPRGSVATNATETTSTTFDGEYVLAGNMFNARAETRRLRLTSLDVHTTATTEVVVRVYAANEGSYRASEFRSAGWTQIARATVTGMGYGTPTPVSLSQGLVLEPGVVTGFYVTLEERAMVYSMGTLDGRVYAADEYLSIGEGAAKSYPFGRSYKPRVWNGSFHYEVLPEEEE